MKMLLHTTEIELEPYRFTNNKVLSNTAFGGYASCYYSSFDSAGQIKEVSDIYEDIYLEHKNDSYDYTSEWHIICTCTAKRIFDEAPTTYYLQERYTHFVGEDRIIVQYQSTGTGDVFYLPVYYPKYSPYQNIISCGIIAGTHFSEGEVIIAGFICNPIYKPMVESETQYRGGFDYAFWNDITHGIVNEQHDFSDLSRYPTPDPEIPLNQSFRANRVCATCCIDSTDVLVINGETIVPLTPDTDENKPKTGFGPYKDISDTIDFSSLPAIGPLDTGFIKAYVLTIAQARSLAEFMLSDDFLTNVKKLFLQPIDYIISLHFLPVHPSQTTATTVKIGGVDSEVSAPQTFDSYVTFKSGVINLEEFWGSFLDYAPSTKILCNIPFVGIRELNTDDVMTGNLELQYNINTLDGDFVVELKSDTSHKLNGVIATFQGNMLMSTPVTATDYTNKIMAGFTALSQGITAVAASGDSGANSVDGSIISNTIQATIGKPDFGRSGNVTGGAGMLGNFTPYLIKVRPKQAVPKLYTKLFGKPSMIGGNVSMFKGYTEIKRVDLSGIPCTDNERKEIEELLKGGAFL